MNYVIYIYIYISYIYMCRGPLGYISRVRQSPHPHHFPRDDSVKLEKYAVLVQFLGTLQVSE